MAYPDAPARCVFEDAQIRTSRLKGLSREERRFLDTPAEVGPHVLGRAIPDTATNVRRCGRRAPTGYPSSHPPRSRGTGDSDHATLLAFSCRRRAPETAGQGRLGFETGEGAGSVLVAASVYDALRRMLESKGSSL